jgi:fatty-acyl-CoA synthase
VAFTVTNAFKWWVREHPGRLAIDHDGEEVSYSQLHDWATRVAMDLIESGIKPGDRVSAFGTNSLEYAVLIVATMLAGGISAPVSFRSSVRELNRSLGTLQPRVLLQFLSTGSTIYAQARFTPERSLQLLLRHKITTFLASVIFFERIAVLPEFETADLSSIVFAQISGARVNPALLVRYREHGVVLRQAYGSTEAGGAWAARNETAISEPEKAGRGAMFSEFAIKGKDGGFAPAGYWNNEAATKDAFRDGWLHTGDLGVLDERGNLTFIDRFKDIIISGGLNISAMEVESVIAEVDGVREVVVLPTKDEQFGETPLAIVYGEAGRISIPAVIAHCNAQLSNYKVPRYVAIEAEPLPRLPSGKISKIPLREKYKDGPSFLPKVR